MQVMRWPWCASDEVAMVCKGTSDEVAMVCK